MTRNKHSIIIIGILLAMMFSIGLAAQVTGQADSQDILMTNMDVRATLGTDYVTSIVIKTEVTNIGSTTLDFFDLRIDMRGFIVSNANLNGTSAVSSIVPESNYNLIRVVPNSPMTVGLTLMLNLNLTTDSLQERIRLNDDETMHIDQMIYYIRPLYEVRNLTFTAILPTFAILQSDAAAPLFPIPTMNYTDGFRPIYVWYRTQMLPGQEAAFIIKYQLPAAILQDPASQINSIALGILFLIVGAVAVLFIERIPLIFDKLKTRTVISPIRLSKQEEQVLNFLSKKGGSSPQREIYEDLDMSQSLASTVLTTLEERGLIKRLRTGRENIVHLMEQ
ncbi:MAG: hypothetical protein E3J86_12200 [Candidatus Thorarchaeota archaeon]|nr:MAG: hypothetical protein E3J86_12200 [Candidatus Thorarchaeota archaeon]